MHSGIRYWFNECKRFRLGCPFRLVAFAFKAYSIFDIQSNFLSFSVPNVNAQLEMWTIFERLQMNSEIDTNLAKWKNCPIFIYVNLQREFGENWSRSWISIGIGNKSNFHHSNFIHNLYSIDVEELLLANFYHWYFYWNCFGFLNYLLIGGCLAVLIAGENGENSVFIFLMCLPILDFLYFLYDFNFICYKFSLAQNVFCFVVVGLLFVDFENDVKKIAKIADKGR